MTTSWPKVHPAAEILPPLGKVELDQLARDIQEHGLLMPIALYAGLVLDGRNRLTACQLAGVTPRFVEVDEELAKAGLSPLDYVAAINVKRRHLALGPAALSAARAMQYLVAQGRAASLGNLRRGTKPPESADSHPRGRSDLRVAKLFGVSARSVRMADELLRHNPRLADLVMAGCKLNRAYRQMLSERRQQTESAAQQGTEAELIPGDCLEVGRRLTRRYQLILGLRRNDGRRIGQL